MKVLITGANGFLGQNLQVHLSERTDIEILSFTLENSLTELPDLVGQADFIFHLAGINRPENPDEFKQGNTDLTRLLCDALLLSGRAIPVIYSSSIQAENDSLYGTSKRDAEEILLDYQVRTEARVHIFRLPNVFGKWSRPNYNSVVSTFCHNISLGLPIQVNDRSSIVKLVYVDDVVDRFISLMDGAFDGESYCQIEPCYSVTVGEIADRIYAFKASRETLTIDNVGTGFVRALYATYVSYLSPQDFTYDIISHTDPRGSFAEVLKTQDSGQFSFFTAHPGVTRGGHYHHTKNEKFLVVKGQARFGFRHIISGEVFEMNISSEKLQVVETVPGWSHDITNTGDDEMIVMLWANEVFDPENPDTIYHKV